jgi:hypothetical protein
VLLPLRGSREPALTLGGELAITRFRPTGAASRQDRTNSMIRQSAQSPSQASTGSSSPNDRWIRAKNCPMSSDAVTALPNFAQRSIPMIDADQAARVEAGSDERLSLLEPADSDAVCSAEISVVDIAPDVVGPAIRRL